jgi:hypothetical protein
MCEQCVRYNRSSNGGQGRKRSRNRRYATTGPPQALRRQAQRLSWFGARRCAVGGRMLMMMMMLSVACRWKVEGHLSRPPPLFWWRRADRWRLRNGATPARRLGCLHICWCPGCLEVECGHLDGSLALSRRKKCVDRSPALSKVHRRSGTAAARDVPADQYKAGQ